MGVAITVASSKGGAGKTTAAALLSGELARQGADVSCIDADPNQHFAKYVKRPGLPKNLRLIENANEETITDLIDEEKARSQFSIIDVEGSANVTVTYAIMRSNLVIIPFQASQNDADEAAKTVSAVLRASKAAGRPIPFSLLLTRTSAALNPRNQRAILEDLGKAKIDLFRNRLVDREAFRAVLSYGGLVNDLSAKEVSGGEKAAADVNAFAAEVIEKLKAKGRAAA